MGLDNPFHIHTHGHRGENGWNNNAKRFACKGNDVFVFGVIESKRLKRTAKSVKQMPEERETSEHINDNHPQMTENQFHFTVHIFMSVDENGMRDCSKAGDSRLQPKMVKMKNEEEQNERAE